MWWVQQHLNQDVITAVVADDKLSLLVLNNNNNNNMFSPNINLLIMNIWCYLEKNMLPGVLSICFSHKTQQA